MIERTEERFGLKPERLVGDTAYDGTFSRSDFRYDPTDNIYHCPGGKRLGTSGTVHEGFLAGTAGLRRSAGVTVLAEGLPPSEAGGWRGTPQVLLADPAALSGVLLDECFGPVLVLVRYESGEQLLELLSQVGPALTATIHAQPQDTALARRLWDVSQEILDQGRRGDNAALQRAA